MGAGATVAEFDDEALRRRLGEPLRTLGNERGTLRVWVPRGRGLVVSQAAGHGGAIFVASFLEAVEAAVAAGAHEIWDDWARIQSYDSDARVEILHWTKAHPAIAPHIHVLVGSKLIAMGVTVANLALGNVFHVTSDRRAFEAAVLARLGGHGAASGAPPTASSLTG
jgi:hypothetical protein